MSLEDLNAAELLEHAKKSDEGNRLLRSLLDAPDTRMQALELIRKKNPNLPIPELDTKSITDKALESERKAREDLEAKFRDNEIRTRIKEERERVKSQHELTDADMAEVEKLMVDEKAPIPHWDAAAKVFKASRVLATPTPSSLRQPTVYDMPESDVWKKGIGNKQALDKIAMSEAVKASEEFRAANRGKAA